MNASPLMIDEVIDGGDVLTRTYVGHEVFEHRDEGAAHVRDTGYLTARLRRSHAAVFAQRQQWLRRWVYEVAPPEEWWRE